jgi:hypothetical protein
VIFKFVYPDSETHVPNRRPSFNVQFNFGHRIMNAKIVQNNFELFLLLLKSVLRKKITIKLQIILT